VAAPYVIHTRFELNQVIHVRSAVSGPFHVANDAAERKTTVRVAARQLLEKLEHPVLIEVTVTKICFGVGSKLELTAVLGGRRIDACCSQALQMIVMLPWIDHMDGLITTLKSVLYEWKQHSVPFVVAVEKRTDVTYVAQMGTGKGNWCHGLLHGVDLALLWIARETERPFACFALWSRGKGAFSRQPQRIACTSPNPTSIRLWYWSGGIRAPALAPAGD
jgi:hypothetical protein